MKFHRGKQKKKKKSSANVTGLGGLNARQRSLEILSATPVSLVPPARYLSFSTRYDWKHALAPLIVPPRDTYGFLVVFRPTDYQQPLLLREPVVERELLRKSQHRREKVKRIEYSPSGCLSAPFSDPSRTPPCHIASVSASNMQITSFFRAEEPIFFLPSLETKREREEVANFQLRSTINLGTSAPPRTKEAIYRTRYVRFSSMVRHRAVSVKEIVKRSVRCCNRVTRF